MDQIDQVLLPATGSSKRTLVHYYTCAKKRKKPKIVGLGFFFEIDLNESIFFCKVSVFMKTIRL